jgi:hypothetical protein
MNGGYIKDNIGSGGGVCIGTNCPNITTEKGTPGTFIMKGGVISDNNDQSGNSSSEVKDIRLILGKVELHGGKIIGNFCCDNKDDNTIEIYSGFTSTSSNRCNFYIPKNESSPRVLTIKESLGTNVVYGVRPFYYDNGTMYTYPQVFTSGLSGNGGVSNFESIDNAYEVGLNASNEAMLKNTAEVTITVSEVTGGTISAKKGSEDITTAQMGDEITLTATPADGYELEAFSVKDADGNAVTVTDGKFTMPAGNVTVSATFKKSTYTITVSEATGGTVSAKKGTEAATTAQIGDEITLTATPAEGYELEAFSVKDAAGNAVTVTDGKFTMPAGNVTVSASFKKGTYTITVASDITGGTITAKNGSEDITTAQVGDEITLTATPAEGYELEAFSVKDADGNAVTVTDGKFTMPAGTVTISATFKKTMNNKDITEVAIDPVTFTGDPLTPKPVIKDGDKTLIEGTDYTVSYSSNTDAGTATITITGIGNYSGTVEFTFTIEKADATMTAPTAKTGLVTNNKPQVLINAGSAEGGEMQYSLDGTNYSTELPTGTEAKEYTVYYKVVGDKNHNDVAAQSIKVVISKITNTGLAFVEGDAVAIIGEPVELPNLSNPFGLPVEWISSNEEVATVDQNGVVTLLGPGETEIWVVFKGNAVYEPVSTRFKLTVVQKPAEKSGTGLAFYLGDLQVDEASAKIGEPLELPRLSNPFSLEVDWLSSNEEVATVDKHGKVTLVGPGVTEIWIIFKGNDQFDSVAAMYRLTVEGEPVKPDTSVPTITTQPESVTYVVGDTEYPQLSIEATTTVGDLTYEWFLKNDEGTYQSVGITTSECSLQAFIGNVIELFRDEAIGDYTFMCKVSNVNGTVESDPATLTIAAGDPSAVKTIKTDVQVDGIRKYVKNGKIVIETPRGLYSISGAQIK